MVFLLLVCSSFRCAVSTPVLVVVLGLWFLLVLLGLSRRFVSLSTSDFHALSPFTCFLPLWCLALGSMLCSFMLPGYPSPPVSFCEVAVSLLVFVFLFVLRCLLACTFVFSMVHRYVAHSGPRCLLGAGPCSACAGHPRQHTRYVQWNVDLFRNGQGMQCGLFWHRFLKNAQVNVNFTNWDEKQTHSVFDSCTGTLGLTSWASSTTCGPSGCQYAISTTINVDNKCTTGVCRIDPWVRNECVETCTQGSYAFENTLTLWLPVPTLNATVRLLPPRQPTKLIPPRQPIVDAYAIGKQ